MIDARKPVRRWYQYSLRTLLIFVTLCAFACSWFAVKMQQARKQREAVVAIRKLGGLTAYDYQETGYPYREPPGPIWLRRLLGDDFFANVAWVSFCHTQATDAGLEHLKGLTKLDHLYLTDTEVTGDGLANIAGLTRLQVLYLDGTRVTDAGLEHLKGMSRLQELYLNDTEVTDVGLERLKGLTSLQMLSLHNTRVTNAGLAHLRGLTQLRALSLFGTQVTDEGVKGLQKALPECRIVR
jgi:hypothetical protein